jgi:hypothetical protein
MGPAAAEITWQGEGEGEAEAEGSALPFELRAMTQRHHECAPCPLHCSTSYRARLAQ